MQLFGSVVLHRRDLVHELDYEGEQEKNLHNKTSKHIKGFLIISKLKYNVEPIMETINACRDL